MDAVFEYLGRVATYNPLIVLIELLLMGMVVYWAVSFLEGTRGERLFRGVIIILLAGSMILKFIVVQFSFDRLQFLYNWFLIAVLVIAVAGFQPELRRMLIRIGQAGTLISFSHEQISRTIEEIVRAVSVMSARSTGAIIVIERHVALGEFIETGIKIDARAKAVLLRTIFNPGSALHDMAVVIRGDHIIAARVQLPLAEAGSIGHMPLGSRHRAAIGITRGSDAIAIVVSEETGIVSMAENGKLTRHISESELRQRLTEILVDTTPAQARLWFSSKGRASK